MKRHRRVCVQEKGKTEPYGGKQRERETNKKKGRKKEVSGAASVSFTGVAQGGEAHLRTHRHTRTHIQGRAALRSMRRPQVHSTRVTLLKGTRTQLQMLTCCQRGKARQVHRPAASLRIRAVPPRPPDKTRAHSQKSVCVALFAGVRLRCIVW